ncbi:MAG: hypothetical protein LWX56_11105 [Ignavibacteria bacterium]|nr:hypothetical protein [Ignavibacteria bacterium]
MNYLFALLLLFVSAAFPNGKKESGEKDFTLTTPKFHYVVTFPRAEFVVADQDGGDGFMHLLLTDKNSSYLIIIELAELPDKKTDAARRLELFIAKPTGAAAIYLKDARNIARGKEKGVPYIEFFNKELDGKEVNQQTISGAYIKDGHSVLIHVSKKNYTRADRGIMLSLIKRISFTKK